MFKKAATKTKLQKIPETKDYSYLSVQNKQFVVVDLNFIVDPEKAQETYKSLKAGNFKDKIVKCNIKVSGEQLHGIDFDYLKSCFKESYHCNEITPIVVQERPKRNEEIKAELSDKEAIERFLESSGRQDKQQLMEIILKEVLNA